MKRFGPLNINGIGTSHISELLRKEKCISSTYFEYITDTHQNQYSIKFKQGDIVKINIPSDFHNISPHSIIKEVYNYIITEAKEQYPEYWL